MSGPTAAERFLSRRRVADLRDRLALGSIYLGPVELSTTVHGRTWPRFNIGGGFGYTTKGGVVTDEHYEGTFEFRPFRVRAARVNIDGRLAFDLAEAVRRAIVRREKRRLAAS